MDARNTISRVAGLATGGLLTFVLLGACVLGGSCTEEDQRLAGRIPPYGGVDLEYFGSVEFEGCAAVLEVEADPDEVMDHYRGVLEADGWDVSVDDIRVEGIEGASAADLTARRDGSVIEITLEAFPRRESSSHEVNASIHVNESAGA